MLRPGYHYMPEIGPPVMRKPGSGPSPTFPRPEFGGCYHQTLKQSSMCRPYKSPPERRLTTPNPTSAAISHHQTPSNPPNSGQG